MKMLSMKSLDYLGSLGKGGLTELNEDKGELVLPEASNAIDIDKILNEQMTAPAESVTIISIEEIRNMIAQLGQTEDGEPLKNAMSRLKKGIKDNPEACALLLPEDIGDMVKALYRMTDRDLEIATDKANKRKPAKSKIDLSDAKIQQEILDDL